MEKKMSKRSKILELLAENELTTKEIQEKTGYDMDLIWQYINQFKKENKIEQIDKKGRFFVYTAIKKNSRENLSLLKFMNDFFKDNADVLFENEKTKDYILKHDKRFDRIEVLTKNA